MDQLEREVREMLREKAAGMPEEYEASSEFVRRVSRRRTTKLAGLSLACLVAVGGVVATLASAQDKKRAEVATVTSVPKGAGIPAIGCPTVAATSDPSASFGAPTFDIVDAKGINAKTAAQLEEYIARGEGKALLPTAMVLAPRGYVCRMEVSGDGEETLNVAPTLGAPFAFGGLKAPYVTVFRDFFGHGATAGLQCRMFGGFPELAGQLPRTSGECDPGPTPTIVSPGVVRWTDLAAHTSGVAVLEPAQRCQPGTPCEFQIPNFDVVTCALDGAKAALCEAILDDYIARNPGALPSERVVMMSGQIGRLQLGSSSAADVRAAAGKPDATKHGSFGAGLPDYDALGYDCTSAASSGRDPMQLQPSLSGPYCTTIYYVNATTKTLAGFESTSPDFQTEKGTKVGMTEADAAANEGKPAVAGCSSGIMLGAYPMDHTKPIGIYLYSGTHPTDQILRIAAEWTANQVGVLFC